MRDYKNLETRSCAECSGDYSWYDLVETRCCDTPLCQFCWVLGEDDNIYCEECLGWK
jgi:hypothetical protein